MAVSNIKYRFHVGCILMSALWLGACGNETGNVSGNGVGHLNLSITDAPVDGAEQVVVEFSGVEIHSDLGVYTIDYASPKTIDLLALQGGQRELLLEDYELVEGNHSWIRLKVNAEADGIMDSYIRINGADFELHVPSGAQTGLKLINPFNVVDGENLDFTIDFDLRKSVQQPNGQVGPSGDPVYFLRPTLRLVETNANASGGISGMVDPLLFVINEQNCSAQEAGYVVYLYEGDVTPDDMDGNAPDPVTTATVNNDYSYTLTFLEPGDYTIAITCVGDLDDPETDDAAVTFVGTSAISVTAGANTSHNFLP